MHGSSGTGAEVVKKQAPLSDSFYLGFTLIVSSWCIYTLIVAGVASVTYLRNELRNY